VCLPIIEWGFRFQRPQQLMARFAATGHRVFYVSQTFRGTGPPCLVKRLLPGVFDVSLRGPKLNIYQDALCGASTRDLLTSLKALRADQAIRQVILMVQLPFWWPLAKRARRSFGWPIIYDCMDHHAGFTTNHPRMLNVEPELLTHADLVVASSAPLEAQARRYNSRVLLVRNGCEYEHFAKVRQRTRTTGPVVGYYGAIAHWFDSDLVADLAERRPDWQFILVGSTHTADLGLLAHLPNVSLPGEQPYEAIPKWLARFDVAILPFKRTPLTESTNPVKAYEILAAGKPLVTVPLPEMLNLRPLVQTASTPREFEREIEHAMQRRSTRHVTERRAYAKRHTWQVRWETLVAGLATASSQHQPPGVYVRHDVGLKRKQNPPASIRRSPHTLKPPA
jgi:glycosyltransferase involved in cell wall biosynthesis